MSRSGCSLYWFIRQGFSEKGITSGSQFPPELWEVTRESLLIWAGFFTILLLVILLAE